MREYTKIETVFKRGEDKKLTEEYRSPEIEYLKDNEWVFTEKIDGTNIRVHWDGHKVEFGGRTDKAEIPKHLLARLEELFAGTVNEEIFEQLFADKDVILFGEGYGEKVQVNGYTEFTENKVDFILFDILVDNKYWLKRDALEDIAKQLNIKIVPIVTVGTIEDGIKYVLSANKTTLQTSGRIQEGIVGKPAVEMQDRNGNRIIVKIKLQDFNKEWLDKHYNK